MKLAKPPSELFEINMQSLGGSKAHDGGIYAVSIGPCSRLALCLWWGLSAFVIIHMRVEVGSLR